MSTNPISLRLPQFDLETPEGRAAAHRYNVSGIVDLNQAIAALKSQVDAKSTSTAQTITTSIPSPAGLPVNTPAITHQWINSYNSTSGSFTQTQPDYSDLTGTPTLPVTKTPVTGEYLTGYDSTTGAFSQSTPAGISVTITTAALTLGGTQGSQTFTNGILTAQVQAT